MNGKTVGILLGVGLVGVAVFVLVTRRTQQKPDPIANLLGAAPIAIGAAGSIVSSTVGSAKGVFTSIF